MISSVTSKLKVSLPITLPKVLYKYRDWENDFHKKTLLNGELFLSSPGRFNDPYDCKIPVAYYLLAEDPILLLEYFTDFVSRHYQQLSGPRKMEEVTKLIKDGRYNDPNWILHAEQQQFREISEAYGVISLTQHKNNILLWSHYANSHSGFCIGFKASQLLFNESRFGAGGKVMYTKEFPVVLPTDDTATKIFKQIYTKSSIWKYEDEYRCTKHGGSDQTVKFTVNEVQEIIVGLAMHPSNIESIVRIRDCNFPGVPVFQTKALRNVFKLGFVQIA